MNIALKPEDQRFVEKQVAEGRYSDVGEVVHKALDLLQRRLGINGEKHSTARNTDRLRLLRRRIEESGIPLLDDDQLRREIKERKGTRG